MTSELEKNVASIVRQFPQGIDCVDCCKELHGDSYEFMELHDTMKSLWQLKLRGFLDYRFGKFTTNSRTLSLFDREELPCPKK